MRNETKMNILIASVILLIGFTLGPLYAVVFFFGVLFGFEGMEVQVFGRPFTKKSEYSIKKNVSNVKKSLEGKQ